MINGSHLLQRRQGDGKGPVSLPVAAGAPFLRKQRLRSVARKRRAGRARVVYNVKVKEALRELPLQPRRQPCQAR